MSPQALGLIGSFFVFKVGEQVAFGVELQVAVVGGGVEVVGQVEGGETLLNVIFIFKSSGTELKVLQQFPVLS